MLTNLAYAGDPCRLWSSSQQGYEAGLAGKRGPKLRAGHPWWEFTSIAKVVQELGALCLVVINNCTRDCDDLIAGHYRYLTMSICCLLDLVCHNKGAGEGKGKLTRRVPEPHSEGQGGGEGEAISAPVLLRFALLPTSVRLMAGDRLGLLFTGCDLKHFLVEFKEDPFTIHTGAAHPTRLLLPPSPSNAEDASATSCTKNALLLEEVRVEEERLEQDQWPVFPRRRLVRVRRSCDGLLPRSERAYMPSAIRLGLLLHRCMFNDFGAGPRGACREPC